MSRGLVKLRRQSGLWVGPQSHHSRKPALRLQMFFAIDLHHQLGHNQRVVGMQPCNWVCKARNPTSNLGSGWNLHSWEGPRHRRGLRCWNTTMSGKQYFQTKDTGTPPSAIRWISCLSGSRRYLTGSYLVLRLDILVSRQKRGNRGIQTVIVLGIALDEPQLGH